MKNKQEQYYEPKPRELYYVDTKAYEQCKSLGIPYKQESTRMLDEELSRFMNEIADKDNIETTITVMIRTKAYSEEDSKQHDYVYWYETIISKDKDGNTIRCGDIPCGISHQIPKSSLEYEQGKLVPKDYKTKVIYTVDFDKEYVEQLINKSARPEDIRYTVNGSKSWGGFQQDEFLNCSFTELDQRGRLGIAGMYDSDFEITKVKPMERLAILEGNKKK